MSSASSASSSSSVRPSTPGPNSPNALETLLPFLLASKRSLSTVEHVYRANDICASTRTALEKSAIVTARTSFLRSGVASQLNVLQKVWQQTESTAAHVTAEYQDVLASLDEAETRLRNTLSSLQETVVEAKLRPVDEAPRSLLDFVDESGVEGLVTSIRADLKESGKGFEEFQKDNKGFENEVQKVKGILDKQQRSGDSQSADDLNTGVDHLPEVLADMEELAREMAVNLESLVSHFDLCVTAIKHTEGGGDAAVKIAGDLPHGVEVGQHPQEAPSELISDEQRGEMMRVLREDADQVSEVVLEIESHSTQIVILSQGVEALTASLFQRSREINDAFKLLENLGHRLPNHITRSQAYQIRWDGEQTRIVARMEELENAKSFYDDFFRAYHNLIIEIGRRKTLESKRNQIIEEARSKLEQLYEEDVADREEFKNEHGQFIPVDIWPGLLDLPGRFLIEPEDAVVETVPDISKSVIHKAIRRVHG
ncbi:uncharacterized protein KY384_003041 [Bacidia gigantensis]|uniref:uncharacterized protein n=1 Tax=Bacidia gigantensis TaxID=2732470 RepID=UPI001D05B565|nr:uncharacterized protein KY384_003041 [Bacidia gigantensis]KAG8531412.1 hypothetical protein KY384_003041 [Bacidia gigantensis]